eukprot:Hpha_TRINITY_DN22648_c0_g1::TRINITY_DN22648_c0_g1_i1::g.192648::m.192648
MDYTVCSTQQCTPTSTPTPVAPLMTGSPPLVLIIMAATVGAAVMGALAWWRYRCVAAHQPGTKDSGIVVRSKEGCGVSEAATPTPGLQCPRKVPELGVE